MTYKELKSQNQSNVSDLENTPEQSSIHYRIGTFASFKKNMLDSVSKHEVIKNLITRSDSDFSIALLDAWANVLDVISFYQERIINEGFLRTCTDRFSVVQLARPIGYELSPGLAATTFIAFNVVPTTPISPPLSSSPSPPSLPTSLFPLAFQQLNRLPLLPISKTNNHSIYFSTTDATAGSSLTSSPIVIDKGIKIQSVPAQGETPQIFETVERIDAYPEWNVILPLLTYTQNIKNQICSDKKIKRIYFAKKYPQLKEGSRLLIELREPYISTFEESSDNPNTNSKCNALMIFYLITKVDIDSSTQLPYVEVKEINECTNSLYEQDCSQNIEIPVPHQKLQQKKILLSEFTGNNLVASTLICIANAFGDKIEDKELSEIKNWTQNDLVLVAKRHGWPRNRFFDLYNIKSQEIAHLNIFFSTVNSFKVKASIFGHNRPAWDSLPEYIKEQYHCENWDTYANTILEYAQLKDSNTDPCTAKVYLDNTYSTILPDRWIVLESEGTCEQQQQQQPSLSSHSKDHFLKNTKAEISNHKEIVNIYNPYKVLKTEEETVANFLLVSKVTSLSLKPNCISISDSNNCDFKAISSPLTPFCNWGNYQLRKTTVYAQNEELDLSPIIPYDYATQIYQDPFKNNSKSITLDKVVDLLSPGQHILISGSLNNNLDDIGNEIAIIDSIDLAEDKYHTKITLKNDLLNDYDIRTVKINANIAYASHGDTKIEIIGSGDPSQQQQQQFILKQKPLTFFSVANTNSQKPQSSLQITVDDLVWNETQSLLDAGPQDRVYVLKIDDDGTINIIFGDGINGARPPAGIENIKATYRTGIGNEGLIKENQLKLILNKPLGVNSCTNPLATSGAEEPEDISSAKDNASKTSSLIKNLISISDFESFVLSFTGIGKAKAVNLWNGFDNMIYLSIGSATGETIDTESSLFENISASIMQIKDPALSFYLDTFTLKLFNLDVDVYVNDDNDMQTIKSKVEDLLKQEFSYKYRQIGEGVTKQQISLVIQQIQGVVSADVKSLYISNKKKATKTLRANEPIWDQNLNKIIQRFEFLAIHPDVGPGAINVTVKLIER